MSEGGRPFEELDIDGRAILKWILGKKGWRIGLIVGLGECGLD
jgi:hypothetical protein